MFRLCGAFLLAAVLACTAACGARQEENGTQQREDGAQQGQSVAVLEPDVFLFSFGRMPEGLEKGTSCTLAGKGRQQHCQTAADGTNRLVLEVQDADEDSIPGEEYQTVEIGEAEGLLYRCAAGEVQLAEPEAFAQGLCKPQPGAWGVEWERKGCCLRLYGGFTPEELLTAAAEVRGAG